MATRAELLARRDALMQKLQRMEAYERSLANIKKDEEGYSAASDNAGENFTAGVGSGLVRVARGATNLLLPDSLTPEWASDEAIEQQTKTDKDLLNTGAGMTGRALGEIAATAPVGMGLGTAATGLKGALAARGLAQAGKVAGSLPARAISEGAVTAAMTAEPDEQGNAALVGGALGGAMSVAARGGGRLLRGAVKKSAEAENLQTLGKAYGEDLFIPLAQAGDEKSLVRGIYKGLLPYIPGTSGQVSRQEKELLQGIRRMALKVADEGGILTKQMMDDPDRAVFELHSRFKNVYENTVKSYAFNVPADFEQQVIARLQQVRPDIDQQTLKHLTSIFTKKIAKYSDGKPVISGANMLRAKNGVSDAIKGLGIPEDRKLAGEVHDIFDSMIEDQLRQGGRLSNIGDLYAYKSARDSWKHLAPLIDMMKSGSVKQASSKFTPSHVISNAGNSQELLDIGQVSKQVTDLPINLPSAEGRMAGLSAGVLSVGGMMTAPLATGAVLGGANLAATRKAQQFLLGDLATQRRIINALRRDPAKFQDFGSALRAMVTTPTGSEFTQEYE